MSSARASARDTVKAMDVMSLMPELLVAVAVMAAAASSAEEYTAVSMGIKLQDVRLPEISSDDSDDCEDEGVQHILFSSHDWQACAPNQVAFSTLVSSHANWEAECGGSDPPTPSPLAPGAAPSHHLALPPPLYTSTPRPPLPTARQGLQHHQHTSTSPPPLGPEEGPEGGLPHEPAAAPPARTSWFTGAAARLAGPSGTPRRPRPPSPPWASPPPPHPLAPAPPDVSAQEAALAQRFHAMLAAADSGDQAVCRGEGGAGSRGSSSPGFSTLPGSPPLPGPGLLLEEGVAGLALQELDALILRLQAPGAEGLRGALHTT
ncbi:hypothetical protein QJQ45_029619, partial [Haematococcus lacustris]